MAYNSIREYHTLMIKPCEGRAKIVLERNDIFDTLNNLNLRNDEYFVLNRAALVLHGIRYNTDKIEIGCTPEAYEKLKGQENENLLITEGFDEKSVDDIENIPVISLESLSKIKMQSKLPEDKKDLELIDKLLAILDTF